MCWADSEDDCAASFECRTVGRCHAQGGVCLPKSDADCQESLGSEVEGACAMESVMGFTHECRAALDDSSGCQASWACEHHDRCQPTRPADCRYGSCAAPGQFGEPRCTFAAAVIPACAADGRCARDASVDCAHAPVGGPSTAAVTPWPAPATPGEPDERAPFVEVSPTAAHRSEKPAQEDPAIRPLPDTGPPTAVPSPGLGEVVYMFDELGGASYEGTLMHASLMTDAAGFEADPIDMLVLRTMQGDTCRPRATGGCLPLDALWFLSAFPTELVVRHRGFDRLSLVHAT
ncbi:MAG: hypothetical protein ACJAYU_001938 [Bradymonadia bacterium]